MSDGHENEEPKVEEDAEELTHDPATGHQYFKYEEISQHNTIDSLWIVVDNLVYDITKFTLEHPGGEEILYEQGGQDASEPFKDVGHSSDARDMMKQYLIGQVHPTEQKSKTKKSWGQSSSQAPAGQSDASDRSWLTQLFFGIGLGLVAFATYKLVA